jgi:hypothetical protein
VLLDDVEFFFDELVGNIECRAAAVGARVRAELVLLGFEVTGQRFAPGRLRLPLRRPLGAGLFGRLGAGLERAPLFVLDDGRWLWRGRG